MQKVNISTKQMSMFAGKWVAIDPKIDKIIAVGEKFEDIATLVSGKVGEENKINCCVSCQFGNPLLNSYSHIKFAFFYQ